MKLEKRSDGAEEPASVSPTSSPSSTTSPASTASTMQEAVQESVGKKQPVVLYILLLFIAAFFLMALSFFMHQRSNTEVLGELKDSMTVLQAVQSTQEEVISLQRELTKANKIIDELEEIQKQKQALQELYILQQQYSAQNYTDCQNTINRMEDAELPEALSSAEREGIPSPASCYQAIKAAVAAAAASET